jgi:recombination protein RecT
MTKTESKTVAIAPIEVVRRELTAMSPQFAMVLPPHVTPEKFTRVVVTAVQKLPVLLNADRHTLYGAAMAAAQDGLLPDGREGAIVPFKGQCQWMPMVKGILKTVRNSGELASIAAEVIYAADRFRYWVDADGQQLEHEPALFVEDRGEILGVYAIAKTKDGDVYVEAMTRLQVEKVRSVSRAKDSGPWKDWWEEMAKKTVIRRLAKRLPSSTDIERVIERDNDLYDLSQTPQADAQPKTRRIDAIMGRRDDTSTMSVAAPAIQEEAEPKVLAAEEVAAKEVDKL